MPYHGRFVRMAAGDPGFFSGLASIAKKIAPKALGFIPGVGTALSIGSVVLPAAKGLLQRAGMGAKVAGTAAAVGVPLAAGAAGLGVIEAGGAAIKGIKHAFGGKRRRRRMNVANPRALRRGIRRLRGFEKLARKVMVVHSYKRLGGHRIGHGRRKAA